MIKFIPENKKIYFKFYLYYLYLLIFTVIPGIAQAQFVEKGDAIKISNKCFKITEDKLNRYGSIWWKNKIDLLEPFDLNFVLYMGSKDNTGADGIAFLFHNDARGFNATGAVAGGLGYGLAAEFPNKAPISPSVAIEFDTHDNNNDIYNPGFDYGDIEGDHTTVVYNGQVFSKPEFPAIWINPNNPDIENNECQTYRITWSPATRELKLFFNGLLRFNHKDDIVNKVFGGESSVYFGFTGSTGGLSNEQTICLLDPESTPVTQNDVATTEPAKPVTIEVAQNDSHTSNETIVLSGLPTNPQHGVATIVGQNIIYTPEPGFIGTDTFTYEICEASSTKCYSKCATATVTVTVACASNLLPQPATIAASGPTVICNNNQITLSVTEQLGVTYQWQKDGQNTGTNTSTLITAESGVYSIILTNNCGKTNGLNTITLTPGVTPQPVNISASGPTTVCGSGSVVLSVPEQAGFSYQWKKDGQPIGNNAPTFTASVSGVYDIEISTSCGKAESTNKVAFTIIPAPEPVTISASGPTTFCQTGQESVTLSVPAQTGLNYQWKLNGQNAGENNPAITVKESGEYKLVLTNSCGISLTASNSITVNAQNLPEQPIIRAGGPTEICPGASVTLTAFPGDNQPTESTLSYSYLWSNGATEKTITATAAGTYSVILRTAAGCEVASAPVKVTLTPGLQTPVISASGPTTVCGNGQVNLSVPEQAGAIYQWKRDGLNIGTNSNIFTANQAGIYSILVTNTCSQVTASNTLTFTVNPLPKPTTITADGPVTLCGNGTVNLSVPEQAGITYQWQKDGQNTGTNGPTLTATEPGEYSINLTNGCGTLAATNKIKVTSGNTMAAPVVTNGERCGPGSVMLKATGALEGNFKWYSSATATTALAGVTGSFFTTPALVTTTTYYVSIAQNGCETPRVPVLAGILEMPTVSVSPNLVINSGESTVIKATGGITYNWQPVTGLSNPTHANPTASPTETTTYTVTVTNANGCTNQGQVTIKVSQDLMVPTAISPNGDGVNDSWEITNIQNYPQARIEIFNRWGSKLYDTTNYRNTWNGTWQGSPLPVGTYFYVITLNKGRKLTGPVSIVH